MAETVPLEAWRKIWRVAAPLLSTAGLEALQKALLEDSPTLLQGCTTSPPPLACVQDWPVEGACLIGYCFWQGDGLKTVGEVEEAFAKVCHDIDEVAGEPAACRWLLNAFDELPRSEVFAALLPEVNRELERRKECAA